MEGAVKHSMKRGTLLGCLLITLTLTTQAQRPLGRPGPLLGMEPRLDVGLYSCLVSDSVCTKFLLLGIPGNIPVLTRDEGHPGSYVARFDVDVYAFDETKSQVFHAATQRTIVSSAKGDRSHEAPPPMYITRISLDTLPPRARTLQLIVEDRSSSRTIQHTVPLPARLSSRFSSLFVVDTSRAADRFELASVGNVVPFGGNIRLLMQVRQGGSSLAQLSGRLTPVHPLPNASAIPAPTLQALGERSLSVVTGDSNVVLTPVTDPRCDAELVLLDIHSAQLEEGAYSLQLFDPDTTSPVFNDTLAVHWFNKPVSLTDPQVRIEVMQYIMSADEFKALKGASEEEQSLLLKKFWSKFSPLPFNKPLEEYYRRVDETMRRFATLRGDPGWQTDRGRVYILYGRPEEILAELPPGSAPKEIWVYPAQRKKFVFVQTSTPGDYKLDTIESIPS